jgi:hypothetical protein
MLVGCQNLKTGFEPRMLTPGVIIICPDPPSEVPNLVGIGCELKH